MALGSSMAAGPGITPRAAGCAVAAGRSAAQLPAPGRRSDWPRPRRRHLLRRDHRPRAAPIASAARRPRSRRSTARRALVTVTIGGNDVGYVPLLFAAGAAAGWCGRLPVLGGAPARTARPAARDAALDAGRRVAVRGRAGAAAARTAGPGAVRRLPDAAAAGRTRPPRRCRMSTPPSAAASPPHSSD